MAKSIIYNFVFESIENMEIDSTIEDYANHIVQEDFLINSLKKYCSDFVNKDYKHLFENEEILQHFKTLFFDIMYKYFVENPRLKFLFKASGPYSTDFSLIFQNLLNYSSSLNFFNWKRFISC